MSRLNKESSIVSVEQSVETSEKSADYVPQHPLMNYNYVNTDVERDHLEQYVEVRPFENTEGKKFSKLYNKAKGAGKSVLKGGKSLLKGRKIKSAAKKVRKVIDTVENQEKIIKKERAKFDDKEAFDKAVTKKATQKEKEIYNELIN